MDRNLARKHTGVQTEARGTEHSRQSGCRTEGFSNGSRITQGNSGMDTYIQYLRQLEADEANPMRRVNTLSNESRITQGIGGMDTSYIQYLRQAEENAVNEIRSYNSLSNAYVPRHRGSSLVHRATVFGDVIDLPSSLITGMRSLDIKPCSCRPRRRNVNRTGRNPNVVMTYHPTLPMRDRRRPVEFNRNGLYSTHSERRELEAHLPPCHTNRRRQESPPPSLSSLYSKIEEFDEPDMPPFRINHERRESHPPCFWGLFPAQPIRSDIPVSGSRRNSYTTALQHAESDEEVYPPERYGWMVDGL